VLFQYCILISKYLNFNGVFLNKTSFLVYCRLSPVVVCYTPNAFRPQMHSGTSKRVWGSQIPKCIWFCPKCISGRSEMHLGTLSPSDQQKGLQQVLSGRGPACCYSIWWTGCKRNKYVTQWWYKQVLLWFANFNQFIALTTAVWNIMIYCGWLMQFSSVRISLHSKMHFVTSKCIQTSWGWMKIIWDVTRCIWTQRNAFGSGLHFRSWRNCPEMHFVLIIVPKCILLRPEMPLVIQDPQTRFDAPECIWGRNAFGV
jgi:hypothetical protein